MKIEKFLLALAAALGVALTSGTANADASGPDFFRVVDVTGGDRLNMRTAASTEGAVISSIPPDANGITNFGCQGGLTLEQWSDATEAERNASRSRRWCLVGYDRVIGWSSGRFLAEGSGPDAFEAGERIGRLEGSEWRAVRISSEPTEVEATVAFGADGAVSGNSGCNRFMGRLNNDAGVIAFGPLAATRKACPEAEMRTEANLLAALEEARRFVATQLVLALLDEDGVILAQFKRTDWD